MTPTQCKFRFPQVRNFDHYNAYASKNLEQLSFWQAKRIRFFQFQVNFLKPTQHDLNTTPYDITTTPSVKKFHHQIYQLFREQKQPQNFIFQNHIFTSPFSYHSPLFLKSSLHHWYKSKLRSCQTILYSHILSWPYSPFVCSSGSP